MVQLRQSKLHEQLAAQLAQDIVGGRLDAGAPIPSEPELVDAYGVSKTVVRETVQALAAVGLARVQQGKRTVALPEEEWNILSPLVQQAYRSEGMAAGLVEELYAVRILLEPRAARWAAERAGAAEVRELEEILAAMLQAEQADDQRKFLDYDREFHFAIANMSGNRVLRAIIRDIHELLLTSWLLTRLTPDETDRVFRLHQSIARAIADSNPDEAEKAMQEHLEWAAQTDRLVGRASQTSEVLSP